MNNDLYGKCGLQPEEWKKDTPYECQVLCQEIDACVEFTWISPDHESRWVNGRNRCCLKHTKNQSPTVRKGRLSGPKVCGKYPVNIVYI